MPVGGQSLPPRSPPLTRLRSLPPAPFFFRSSVPPYLLSIRGRPGSFGQGLLPLLLPTLPCLTRWATGRPPHRRPPAPLLLRLPPPPLLLRPLQPRLLSTRWRLDSEEATGGSGDSAFAVIRYFGKL